MLRHSIQRFPPIFVGKKSKKKYSRLSLKRKKIGQVRVELVQQGFHIKIRGLGLFLKFSLSLARALSSDTSLELATLTPNFAPLLRLLFFLDLTTNV